MVLAFYGEARGELILAEAEVQEVRWFTLDEARALALAFDHNTILDAFAEEFQ